MSKRVLTTTGILLAAALVQGIALAQSNATLIIHVKTGNEPANAIVRVLGPSGEEIAKKRSGESINVPPGIYTISVQNLDLIDKPERRRRNVHLVGGQLVRHTSRWTVAKVKLIIRAGRRTIRGARIVLFHAGGGEQVAEFRSGRFIKASPGHYVAKVYTGRNYTTVSGLQFIEGAEQVIPIQIR